jgi:hypothetical protein
MFLKICVSSAKIKTKRKGPKVGKMPSSWFIHEIPGTPHQAKWPTSVPEISWEYSNLTMPYYVLSKRENWASYTRMQG